MPTTFPIDGIFIDRSIATNLHRQLYSQLRSLIERRILPSGTALPSTRLLTKDLAVGRNTVIAAYEQLALEGYLLMRRGSPPGDGSPAPASTAKNARRDKQHISARKIMLAQPIICSPGLLHFIPTPIPTIPLHHMVEAAQQKSEAGAPRPVWHLSHRWLPTPLRSHSPLSHGVARNDLQARTDCRDQWCPIGL
jgi:DNA-binding transcriptional MocR family regulator